MRPSSSGPGVDAHADAQRPADLGAELGVDVVEREIDGARGPQRLPAADLDAVVLAEDGQQAVAQELVDPAAVRVDGGAGRGEELVEDEDDVVGQAALRELREVAQVEEHDGQRLLDAGRIELLHVGGLRARCWPDAAGA